jgi:uncharacterized tellurite resistance protein B-like protein
MFLNRLEKEEKIAFLELAHYIARSDNDFSKLEENIINEYCIEMQIYNVNFDENLFDIDKTLSKISDKKSQKIVLLEVITLIYSDNYLHIGEQKVLDTIVEKFDIDKTLYVVYTEWAKSILALYIQGDALIEL